MKTLLAIVAALAVSGCATCRDHPVACAVVGAVVIGSIAASIDHDGGPSRQASRAPINRPICAGGAC
jgi:hypothetical protein